MVPKPKRPAVAPYAGQPREDKKSAWPPAPTTLAEQDGYQSEHDDRPMSHFEQLMRERQRLRTPEAAQRLLLRASLTAPPTLRIDQLLEDPAQRYRQHGGNCLAHCAVYAALRRRAYSSREIVYLLNGSSQLQKKIPEWQNIFSSMPFSEQWQGFATSISARFSEVENNIHKYCTFFGKNLPGSDRSKTEPIVFPVAIGHYNAGEGLSKIPIGMYHVDFSIGKNRVISQPFMPTHVGPTFQSCLLHQYRPSNRQKIAFTIGRTSNVASRHPEPLVLLILSGRLLGRQNIAHAVMLDLRDMGNIQLFDPNVGILTLKGGLDSLSLEASLAAIWNKYFCPQNFSLGSQGFKKMKKPTAKQMMVAFQLHYQDLSL